MGRMKGESGMTRPVFSEDDRRPLRRERFEHPHPRVPLRREVWWRISCGESYSSAARRADVSDATVDRDVARTRHRRAEAIRRAGTDERTGRSSDLAGRGIPGPSAAHHRRSLPTPRRGHGHSGTGSQSLPGLTQCFCERQAASPMALALDHQPERASVRFSNSSRTGL